MKCSLKGKFVKFYHQKSENVRLYKKKSYSSLFFSSAGLCASHFTKHFFLVVQCIITSNCKLFTLCRQMIKHWLQHASYWVFRSHRCACGFAIVKLRRLVKHLQNHFQKARCVPFAYLQEIIRMKIFLYKSKCDCILFRLYLLLTSNISNKYLLF